MTLAARLIKAREAKGLGQTELAQLVGITQPSLHQIENGETENPRLLRKIAEVLNVDPGWLHYGSVPTTSYEKVPLLTFEQIAEHFKDKNFPHIEAETKYINFPKIDKNLYAMALNKNIDVVLPSYQIAFLLEDIVIINPDIVPLNNDFVLVMKEEWFQPSLMRYVTKGERQFITYSHNPEIDITNETIIYGVVIMRLNYLT